jgi:hypothetical protein
VKAGAFEYQSVEGVYEHAASLVKEGKTKAEVCNDLKSCGLNDERASIVADSIFDLRAKAVKESGQLNTLYGALFCVGGIVATAVTCQIAAGLSVGGPYMIAWGAIVFGALQLFCGLIQKAGIG